MERVEQAKITVEQMNLEQSAISGFPEFTAVKNNLIYGEVFQNNNLDSKQKMLITITALVTVESLELKELLQAALKQGVTPVELQEIFHQVAPYVGFAKAEKGLAVLNEVFGGAGVSLPLENQGTVTEANRLEKGIAAQKSLFGPMIDAMRANAPENQKFIQDYLSAYCFGDTYTRQGLDLKTRELLTFVSIIALGGCDSQANSHAIANIMVGNNPDILFATVAQCMPYIGFPRTLNAVTGINNALNTLEQMRQQQQNQSK